jgi:hypothetical protein
MNDSKRPRAQRKKPGSEAAAAGQKRPAPPTDIAILHSPTEDGKGARVVRIRDGEVSAGEIRPVREGEAINQSEVVRLRPMEHDERVCEVEVLHAPPAAAQSAQTEPRSASSGPARVTTPNYRKNWSTIFEPQVQPVQPANAIEREGESKNDGPKKRSKSEWSVN